MIKNVYNKKDDEAYIVEEFLIGKPNKLIICVHGFGTDRGDGGGLFFDLAKNQQNAVVVLVDLNSIDTESGLLSINNLSAQAERLRSVISEFTTKYPELELNLIAHSMGCALLSKYKIRARRVIFLAPASSNVEQALRPRLLQREGSLDDTVNRRIIAKRSDGSTTIVPYSFFDEIRSDNWVQIYQQYLQIQNPLNLIVAGEDEVLKEATKDILKLNFSSIEVIAGADHNFISKKEQMLKSVSSLVCL